MFLNKNNLLNTQKTISIYWIIPIGFVLGVLGGLFGIGLSFLYLPVMVILYKVPIKNSIGSALFNGAILTAGALLARLDHIFEWQLSVFIVLGSILGTLLGGVISTKIKPQNLQYIVAVIITGIALKKLIDVIWKYY